MSGPSVVESIFLAALEKGTAEDRAVFLNAACKDDPDLRRRVERLLEAKPKAEGFLEEPVRPALEETGAYLPSAEQVGTVIAGRYKLLEQIGEGGMGTVCVAEQTQPVRRKVALKLIKPGMDSKTVLSRFEAERQALALMDHPNIAKVLDGGTTESGRPYFVMEYVKGVPFNRYCDDVRLSIAQRLALFVPVCQAVQHAHQKGIIHRDLKPSNILICLYDGKPVPKVIDFGLAKAMHQPLTEHTLYTAHGVMMGTPLYMSPEQAELNNLDVDTRTDIYALGVILYELLTGTTPLEKQRFKEAAWQEMLRLIKEEEPPRPSVRLSGSGFLPSVAAQRQLEPVKLTRLVRGELDWIVMKCLEKDRSRRYDTAIGLARDLERYLHDEVVEARPPTAGYRLRKFVRKHRTALTTATTIALLLAAGVAVSTWQAVRATRSEQEARLLQLKAQENEKMALKSAAESAAVLRFFKEVTHEMRCNVKEGDEWRPKTVEEATALIDSDRMRALFADYPVAEADIREWIATGFDFNSPVGKASLSLAGVVYENDEPKGPHVVELHPGGETIQLRFYYDREAMRRHLERAVELRSVHLGSNHPKTLNTMRELGMASRFNDNQKALQVFGDLVARSSAAFGSDHGETLGYKNDLAQAYLIAEKPGDAVKLLEDNYMIAKKKSGADSEYALFSSDSLAEAFEQAGRSEDALRQREESLRGRRKLAAGSIDSSVGHALRRVARLYDRKQDYARAEPLWREALRNFKDDENDTLDVRASLGRCLLGNGKAAEAEPVLRKCLAIREKRGPEDWVTFHIKSMLGAALLGQKKYADAEPLLLTGYEGMKKWLGKYASAQQDPLMEAMDRLVQLYEATGKKDKADAWRKQLREAKNAAKNPAKP